MAVYSDFTLMLIQLSSIGPRSSILLYARQVPRVTCHHSLQERDACSSMKEMRNENDIANANANAMRMLMSTSTSMPMSRLTLLMTEANTARFCSRYNMTWHMTALANGMPSNADPSPLLS